MSKNLSSKNLSNKNLSNKKYPIKIILSKFSSIYTLEDLKWDKL